MPSKRNRVLESDSKKEETDKQKTDNRQSQLCAPLTYRITGGARVLQPQTTQHGRPTLSTRCLKVQN